MFWYRERSGIRLNGKASFRVLVLDCNTLRPLVNSNDGMAPLSRFQTSKVASK